MGLEDIKKKILKDAHRQRDELLDQAKKKKKEIIDDYKHKSEAFDSAMNETAQAEGEAIKRGIVIDARQRLNNEMLSQKRAILAESFTDATQDFLQSSEYLTIMAALTIEAVGGKDSEIILSASEKKLDKSWLDKVAKTAKVKLSFAKEKGRFKGGLIVQQGLDFINITVEALFDSIKEDAERDLAEILF